MSEPKFKFVEMGPDIKINRVFLDSASSVAYNSAKKSFNSNETINLREYLMPLSEL